MDRALRLLLSCLGLSTALGGCYALHERPRPGMDGSAPRPDAGPEEDAGAPGDAGPPCLSIVDVDLAGAESCWVLEGLRGGGVAQTCWDPAVDMNRRTTLFRVRSSEGAAIYYRTTAPADPWRECGLTGCRYKVTSAFPSSCPCEMTGGFISGDVRECPASDGLPPEDCFLGSANGELTALWLGDRATVDLYFCPRGLEPW
ncbi:MAG TPA: hypothetical protein RMH99_27290 [Sandaracinaceae bacterium LLY-WYZ-13_1]|nr:hypothetical protein [Sandaracinaceae bacterium LLY-WYZ-13_1]